MAEETEEIKLEELVPEKFVEQKIAEIRSAVGEKKAVNALSGGVDSSVVTVLAHKALGERLLTYFIDTGLMREGEPQHIVSLFNDMGIPVKLVDEHEKFFAALKGRTDPEEKRDIGITNTFYKEVFGPLVEDSGAKYLIHGTNWTDVEETVAGVKRQHNILSQLGIDPEKEYGYSVLEPLLQLRKPAIRVLGKHLELPEGIYNRPPFPGPGLAVRVIGGVTPERIAVVRAATSIVEEELEGTGAFQYLAILHSDKVTGMRAAEGGGFKRDYGHQIEVRCWDSKDAKVATPTKVPHETLERIADRITEDIKGVVSVTYNITKKPTSTIEAE